MIYLKAKAVKNKFNSAQKQISKSALEILDRNFDVYLDLVIARNTGKRITAKTIQL